MAAEVDLPENLADRARVIRREFHDLPILDELADEVDRLQKGLADARILAAQRRWPLVQCALRRLFEESN